MAGLFIHAPGSLPPVDDNGVKAPAKFPGLQSITWTGGNGLTFELSKPGASGVYLRAGVRGLNMPPVKRYTSTSPAVDGSRWRGAVVEERDVFWPVSVARRVTSQAWVEHDRAWWSSLDPMVAGTWTVTQPDGSSRYLTCRYTDDGGHAFDIDPTLNGWAQYGIYLVAESPFWMGDPIVRSWTSAAGDPAYPKGPSDKWVLNISRGSTMATARLENPGDLPFYPVWTITGPATSCVVGVQGRTITVPFSLSSGQSLVIDTNPSQQTAIDSNGLERTGELGAVDFASVPPGESVELSLEMVGTGSVTASASPRYYRAW